MLEDIILGLALITLVATSGYILLLTPLVWALNLAAWLVLIFIRSEGFDFTGGSNYEN